MHNDPVLKIDDSEIPVVNEYKFLGVIFDKKLSIIPHIKYLKNKSTHAQQLLRVIGHTQTLIKLYRTLLRSQLDYGIFIYRSARKSYLKKIDPIHHESLRLVLGTFRTSPIDSLYAEAHETPLQIRSEKLTLQYYTKLKSSPSNPAYDCTFDPKYGHYLDQKEKSIRPFGFCMEPILKESTIPLNNIHKSTLPQIPPWQLKIQKLTANWINSIKQRHIPSPTKKNIKISSNSIPTTYVSIQMDPKTTIKQHLQQSWAKW